MVGSSPIWVPLTAAGLTSCAALIIAFLAFRRIRLQAVYEQQTREEMLLLDARVKHYGKLVDKFSESYNNYTKALIDGIASIQKVRDALSRILEAINHPDALDRSSALAWISDAIDQITTDYQKASAVLNEDDRRPLHTAKSAAIHTASLISGVLNGAEISKEDGTDPLFHEPQIVEVKETHRHLRDLQDQIRDVINSRTAKIMSEVEEVINA